MRIISWLLSLLGEIGEFFRAFLNAAKDDILEALLAEAYKAVLELAQTDLTNKQKRNEAFERIKNSAIGSAEEVGESLINTAIEMAVQRLKDAQR